MNKKKVPVIDIFAGPGGLGEGFAQAGFNVILSIEKDPIACQTLTLRKFYNSFKKNKVPKEYYQTIKSNINIKELANLYPIEWENAESGILQIEVNNKNEDLIHNKIKEKLRDYGNDFILLGGPPCQAYSISGRSKGLGLGKDINGFLNKINIKTESNLKKKILMLSQKIKIEKDPSFKIQMINIQKRINSKIKDFYKDPKHDLYKFYLNIIKKFKPTLFIMENVKGLNSAKINFQKENLILKILKDIDKLNYNTVSLANDSNSFLDDDFIIKSENYGIPQNRHRIFITGIKKQDKRKINKLEKQKKNLLENIIFDMPKIRSGLSKVEDSFETWIEIIGNEYKKKISKKHSELFNIINKMKSNKLNKGKKYIKYNFTKKNLLLNWIIDKKLNGVIQHQSRSHMNSDLIRYFYLSYLSNKEKKQKSILDVPSSLKPDHKNITIKKNKLTSFVHTDRFKVQLWGSPTNTITSHISKDGHYFIHPDYTQCRSLSPREAARIQTFPDNYFFCGGRTMQYQQIGNAVPPYLAYQIAKIILQFLKKTK